MELVINPRGQIRCVYTEAIDLASFGSLSILRASHVEPDEQALWHADLAASGGPCLGPFPCRSQALAAEQTWLEEYYLLRQG